MENQKVDAERRQYPRISAYMEFELETEDDIITAEMINLSCSGAYCKVNKQVPLMTHFRIVFPLIYGNEEHDVEYVECSGTVVRAEEILPEENIYNIAIFFNEIEDSERNKIMTFIERIEN
ncbi:PilZ domain-containing protein [Desulfonema magnum]|uniref:PilZ domain-containing protein n=1 Tax=Desulfonema magnum TaxID=45655 RepID=A0A975GTA5_9BACT|nr:PilZ domain-containing protein [Desulfonema magnum]QTA91933.1 PilZ domain-containing protein [Desulfonema magnum]